MNLDQCLWTLAGVVHLSSSSRSFLGSAEEVLQTSAKGVADSHVGRVTVDKLRGAVAAGRGRRRTR